MQNRLQASSLRHHARLLPRIWRAARVFLAAGGLCLRTIMRVLPRSSVEARPTIPCQRDGFRCGLRPKIVPTTSESYAFRSFALASLLCTFTCRPHQWILAAFAQVALMCAPSCVYACSRALVRVIRNESTGKSSWILPTGIGPASTPATSTETVPLSMDV